MKQKKILRNLNFKKTKKNFWHGKKVFITGIEGFVGSNLAKSLILKNAKVFGLKKEKKKNSLLKFEKYHQKCKIYKGDITNKKLLLRILSKNKIQVCFHLAAQPEVGLANSKPYTTWETNVKGTYTLMEALRQNKNFVKSIVVASSDKAYGNYPKKKLPYNENYELRPKYPYDVSKACADLIAKSYANELFKLPIVITRFSNIYGPGQLNFSAIFPDAIRSIVKNKNFQPRSSGKDLRDYIFIKDIVDVYLLISMRLFKDNSYSGHVFNAGNNNPLSVKKILKLIFYFKNKKAKYAKILSKMKNKKTVGEISFQSMNAKKLYKFFKWKPKYSISSSLSETFDWYERYLNKK